MDREDLIALTEREMEHDSKSYQEESEASLRMLCFAMLSSLAVIATIVAIIVF